jgi:multicomponent Na+:H+ antiporter subunit D
VNALLPLFFVGPLLAAAVSLLVGSTRVRWSLGLAAPVLVLAGGLALIWATRDGSVVVAQVAGWPGGVAIPFVADTLSALLLTMTGILVVAGMVFARAAGHGADPLFPPLALMMTAGVYGAYLTADLFNLFVMIEVALLPSYVLMARSGTAAALSAARLYLTVNLCASTLFLAGVGAVYGTAGTVNLAALAGQGVRPSVAVAVGVVLVALAVKGALVPVHTWLPATYPHATPAVSALFSGLLTKVGVYALIRVGTMVFEPGPAVSAAVLGAAVLSMVVGVLGALGEATIRGVLSFHMVSQVGYILVGLGLGGTAGLAAMVFFMLQYSVVKTSLFLTGGAVEVRCGTGAIADLGGVARERFWVGVAFLIGALSLTGLPPFSGFWGKWGLLDVALTEGRPVVFTVALLVSLGTMASMLKLGVGVFWGERPQPGGSGESQPEPARRGPTGAGAPGSIRSGGMAVATAARPEVTTRASSAALVAPGLLLAVLGLVVGLYPEPLIALAEVAGATLDDPSAYVTGVLGR